MDYNQQGKDGNYDYDEPGKDRRQLSIHYNVYIELHCRRVQAIGQVQKHQVVSMDIGSLSS